jgi:GNAT superfamily N-acetyltransferase
MRAKDFINEDIMKYTALGMGLGQYTGKEYALAGGWRSGNSSAGLTRVKYLIIDMAEYEKDPDGAEVGAVDLFVEDGSGKIKGLVNIKLNPNNRKAGIGSKIVKDIVDTAGGELKIFDVKPGAVRFWEKQGIVWDNSKIKKYGTIK